MGLPDELLCKNLYFIYNSAEKPRYADVEAERKYVIPPAGNGVPLTCAPRITVRFDETSKDGTLVQDALASFA